MKLCPMKQNVNVTKGFENEHHLPQEEHIASFGECDKDKCAWWRIDGFDSGFCTVIDIAWSIMHSK